MSESAGDTRDSPTWDAVLISSAHDGCGRKRIVREGALVIDIRNATGEVQASGNVTRP